MSLPARLRAAAAPVLGVACLVDVALRRGGAAAAAVRLSDDAPWLAAWEERGARHGAFVLRCVLYAGFAGAAFGGLELIGRRGVLRKLLGAVVAAAGAGALAHALGGAAPPHLATVAGVAVALAAAVVLAPPTGFGIAVALALVGDLSHRIWAAFVLSDGGSRVAVLEPAAELCTTIGVAAAGWLIPASTPTRARARLAAIPIALAGLIASLVAPEATARLFRAAFALHEAGLPTTPVNLAASAACTGVLAAIAARGAAPLLFALLACARRPMSELDAGAIGVAAALAAAFVAGDFASDRGLRRRRRGN
ncbi:MAG TPA: hypothetical protein VEI02_16450 [Planctomycetota bacterium]|nr:hypothetical protein [Planctomycetota bacterium]